MAESDTESTVRATVKATLDRRVRSMEWLPKQLGLRRFARVLIEDGPPDSLIARCETEEDPAGRPAGAAAEPPLEPIRALLEAAGLPVPTFYGADARGEIQLLEDLGDESLRERATQHPDETRPLYTEACNWIARLQAVEPAPIAAFDRRLDAEWFRYKADLFARHGLTRPCRPDERAVIQTSFDRIAAVAVAAPLRLSHRDYQSANLMVRSGAAPGKRLVMIDLQGAFLAPPEYDLVCLLRDSYVELDETELTHQLAQIRPQLPDAPEEEIFQRRFDLLTLSRKCKDLARFCYAARERGDTRYLEFVPTTLRALRRASRRAADREPAFEAFADLIAGIPEPS